MTACATGPASGADGSGCCWCATVVTAKPGGTARPAAVISTSPEHLPPSSSLDGWLLPSNQTTRGAGPGRAVSLVVPGTVASSAVLELRLSNALPSACPTGVALCPALSQSVPRPQPHH